MRASVSYAVRVNAGWSRFAILVSTIGVYDLITARSDVFYPNVHPSGNMWDVLFSTVSPHPFVVLWIPLFMLLTLRNLWSPCEVPLVMRLRRRDQWWLGAVLGAGVQSLVYMTGIMLITLVFGGFAFGVSWHWSPLDYYVIRASSNPALILAVAMPPVPGNEPAVIALASWALSVLGLWCIGTLASVLALWWKIPWLGIGLILLMSVSSLFPVHILSHIFPGSQFVLSKYVSYSGMITGALWPVLYGSLLLLVAIISGLMLSDNITWSESRK